MTDGFLSDVSPGTLDVLRSIVTERRRQDRKWGTQAHDFGSWLAIFQEEMGEACRAHMEARYRPGHVFTTGNYVGSVDKQRDAFRREIVEAIAVLVAAVECGDRDGWFGA